MGNRLKIEDAHTSVRIFALNKITFIGHLSHKVQIVVYLGCGVQEIASILNTFNVKLLELRLVR